MRRKTPKGISWISRDKVYRVQLHGAYVGQRKTFCDAAQLLSEAKQDLVSTIERYAKKLPVGVTYLKSKGIYRVRLKGVQVIQTKDRAKALRYNEAVRRKLKKYQS